MSAPLAVLGGSATFSEPLHVGRPNVVDEAALLARFGDVLASRWFTNDGPQVRELEARLAEFLDVPHVVAMCNGTIALEIAIRALDLRGEVIVPSFTFVGTAHALQWQEITPVFVDVDPATHNIDPRQIERLLTPRTSGILGVHLWGRACPIDSLEELAARHGLTLLFDAAHAFGATYREKRIGGFGSAEVFSFHATKVFTTFEGGAVTTHDARLAEKMRWMRNFGFAGYDRVDHVGTNGKMSEICAAMGIVGLGAMDEVFAVNARNHVAYSNRLASVEGVTVVDPLVSGDNNHQYVVLEIDRARFGLSRDEIVTALWAENVLARRYFTPGAHRMEPYRSYFPNAGLLLPQTERLCEAVMVLPTGGAVSLDAVAAVGDLIAELHAHADEVRAALASS